MNLRNEKGIALVITLLVLTLLITLILEFNNAMRVEARAAANFRDDQKAYYLARAGVTFARVLLEEDGRGGALSGTGSGSSSGGSSIDALTETWAQEIPPIPLGDGFVSVKITDEDRKLNLNSAQCRIDLPYRQMLDIFFSEFELESDLSCAVNDWVDKDENECNESCTGAESGTYRGLEDPYEAKNGPFESMEELRLIEGMDDETYRRVNKFLTIYNDDGKINVNTAPVEVLSALDSQMVSSGMVDSIVEFRKEDPFVDGKDLNDRTNVEDVYLRIQSRIKYHSTAFSIQATADVQGTRKTIHAVVRRTGSASNPATQLLYWRVE